MVKNLQLKGCCDLIIAVGSQHRSQSLISSSFKGFLIKTNTMSTYKDLLAFKKAFALAMKIFETSKHFPKEETIALLTS
jgi:hypothetical protein